MKSIEEKLKIEEDVRRPFIFDNQLIIRSEFTNLREDLFNITTNARLVSNDIERDRRAVTTVGLGSIQKELDRKETL